MFFPLYLDHVSLSVPRLREAVEQLDARLGKDATDVEAWLRLVRSRMVLNEPEKAREAYARGLAALVADPAGRGRLEQLGRDLGLGGS